MSARLLTAKEAAAYLGYTMQSFYNRVRSIRHTKDRGVLYFDVEDLDAYRASHVVAHVPSEAP